MEDTAAFGPGDPPRVARRVLSNLSELVLFGLLDGRLAGI